MTVKVDGSDDESTSDDDSSEDGAGVKAVLGIRFSSTHIVMRRLFIAVPRMTAGDAQTRIRTAGAGGGVGHRTVLQEVDRRTKGYPKAVPHEELFPSYHLLPLPLVRLYQRETKDACVVFLP